ncbi:MAG: hypothetical protein Q9174_005994, partial [Haloplaca sp. 1 TL-2023]
MVEKDKPASNIPRLSKLPVRNTVRQANPTSGTGRATILPRPDSHPILVPKSRVKPVPSSTLREQELKDDAPTTVAGEGSISFSTPLKGGYGHSTATGPVTAADPASHQRGPSLSDRAAQSLSRIPPSPSPRRRQSGFFPSDSPAIRPSSVLARSRPATSAGFHPPLPSSRPTSPTKHPPLPTLRPSSPIKRGALARPSQVKVSTLNKPLKKNNPSTKVSRDPKELLPREEDASSRDIHLDAVALDDNPSSILTRPGVRGIQPSRRSKPLSPSTKGNTKPPSARDEDTGPPSITKSNLKSSAALREAVANAKAAKRAAPRFEAEDVVKRINHAQTFDPIFDDDSQHVSILRKRINNARSDGRLNISGMGFNTFPKEVLRMYDSGSMTEGPA